MNTRRKFLRLVDLRVNHYFAGGKSAASAELGRVHSIESLAHDISGFKADFATEKPAGNSTL